VSFLKKINGSQNMSNIRSTLLLIAWFARNGVAANLLMVAVIAAGAITLWQGKIPVDTGFIVYNDQTYPNLTAMFAHLDVPTQASEMSFAVSLDQGALEYAGGDRIAPLFAQKRNLVSPRFWGMLRDLRLRCGDTSSSLQKKCSLSFPWRVSASVFRGRLAAWSRVHSSTRPGSLGLGDLTLSAYFLLAVTLKELTLCGLGLAHTLCGFSPFKMNYIRIQLPSLARRAVRAGPRSAFK
jgi:hypothetical protein